MKDSDSKVDLRPVWRKLYPSSLILVALNFSTGVVFSWLRLRYRSLLPNIVAHASFNLVMNATIFHLLLE